MDDMLTQFNTQSFHGQILTTRDLVCETQKSKKTSKESSHWLELPTSVSGSTMTM